MRNSQIGFLIAGRGEDNHCWFCRASLYGKKPLCSEWCVRRMMDYAYHWLMGASVVWEGKMDVSCIKDGGCPLCDCEGFKRGAVGGHVLATHGVRSYNKVLKVVRREREGV